MTKRLIIPPTALAVSIDAARRAARASGTSLDAELEDKIRGLVDEVEHKTGRALTHQTWELTLDGFPASGAIKLTPARLASVDHVKFRDADGVLRTLHPEDYLVDTKSEPGWIVPAPGCAWPVTSNSIGAVEIQYVCGYGPTEADVPPAIKSYILGMIENDYYPNPNAQYLCRKLDRAVVYG
jgi:uncharacterized phiE125 gp8 family phage protein